LTKRVSFVTLAPGWLLVEDGVHEGNPGGTPAGFGLRWAGLEMKQHALKNVNNCLKTNIYSYLETSGGQSSIPYLNVVHFFNTRVD
jgi:hypothetical protein